MPYDPNIGHYAYVDEQIAFPANKTGKRQPLPRRDIIAAARAQTRSQARGKTPNRVPQDRRTNEAYPDDLEEEEYDDEYPVRGHTSAIRLNSQPEEIYQQGNTRVHIRYVEVPPRRSAQLPPGSAQPKQREVYTDTKEQAAQRPPRKKQKTRFHPLLWLGIGMIAMFILWAALSNLASWWQVQLNDWAYQRPRTFQTDAVVGHADSIANPSHFIAVNLNRHVVIVELPGGDTNKARIYNITTLFGQGQNLTPVTLSFTDVNGDGKPDMIVHIQDQRLIFINDGTQFKPQ